jgi:type II secretory pathway pseudopilin PulG
MTPMRKALARSRPQPLAWGEQLIVHAVRSKDRREYGIALLIAVIIIVVLSGLALSMALLTDSQLRLTRNLQSQGQAYYAALAGLEEVRGRMKGTAPDALGALPTHLNDVLYVLNNNSADSAANPVQPTSSSSPYYDYEYSIEFSGGFSGANLMSSVVSDQPGAGTSSAIQYKWVRITLMSEASAHTDINTDGTLDSTSIIYWDGTQETLSAAETSPVYVLTALAVDSSKVRKLIQESVAYASSESTFVPLAAAATAGTPSVSGNMFYWFYNGGNNAVIDGNDHNSGTGGCPAPSGALAGVIYGTGSPSYPYSSILGSPTFQLYPSPIPSSQTASSLISTYQLSSTLITSVDPSHVTSSSGTYTATGATLGTQPAGGNPGVVKVVYSDLPLTINGSGNSGYGVLLVNGALTVNGGLSYKGVIIANGAITINATSDNTFISGSVLSSGSLSVLATSLSNTALIQYNSCDVTQVLQGLSSGSLFASTPQVLTYRELSF